MSRHSQRRNSNSPARAIAHAARATCELLEERRLFSLPTSFTSVGIGAGGALFYPSYNPANASEIWVATDQSDEYHSTNGGTSWTVPFFQKTQGNTTTPVQYSTAGATTVLFALGFASVPQESTDDGATWTEIPHDPSFFDASFIGVNPSNPQEFFVTVGNTVSYTSNGGTSYSTVPGLSGRTTGFYFNGASAYIGSPTALVQTSNAAATTPTWTTAVGLTGIASGDNLFALAASTAGGVTKFYATAMTSGDIEGEGASAGGAGVGENDGLYSFTAGGSSWTSISTLPSDDAPAFISMVPNDINDVVVAGTTNFQQAPTVYSTSDGGATTGNWRDLFITSPAGSTPGVNTDGTANTNIQTGWEGAGSGSGWGYGQYAFGFTQDPAVPNDMMMTDEGGAYLSTDGGTSWHAAFTTAASLNPTGGATTDPNKYYVGDGMENTSSWYMTFTSSTNMLASFTDITGISSNNDGQSWSRVDDNGNNSNSTYQIIKGQGALSGNLYAATASEHDIYQWDRYQGTGLNGGGGGSGGVLMSSNGGTSWTIIHQFQIAGTQFTTNPVVWTAIDPTNSNRMYASVVVDATVTNPGGVRTVTPNGSGIYMTNDLQDGVNSVWTEVSTPPRTEGHPLDIDVLNDGTLVVTYAGTLNGGTFDKSAGVFVSTNQGASWTDVSASNSALQYFDRDLTIDPTDPSQNTWWLGVWNVDSNAFGNGGLFKTTNRGQTWTQVGTSTLVGNGGILGTGTLPVSQVAFNPANPNEMYVTTWNDGLWYSENAESATPTFTQTAYPFSDVQRVFFNPYVAGQVWVTSFGYGLAYANISTGAAAKVVFAQQPTNTNVNAPITPAVTVDVEDANGNIVTTDNSSVTISLNTGTGTLAGTLTVAAVNGVATFSSLSINAAGTDTLKAVDGALTNAISSSFVESTSTATKLAFVQQPTNATSGSTIAPAVTVAIEDASGNVVTSNNSSVTIAINTGTGTLAGTLTVAAVNGIATFNNLSIATAGAFTLKATDGALTNVVSSSFNISAAAASKLAFIQQPTNAAIGAALSPAVTVAVEDANGNIVTTNSSSITMAINTGTGTLSGTLTVAAVNGVATFSTLSINTAGAFTLKATDGTLTNAISSSFTISAATTVTSVAFMQQPTNAVINGVITPAITVKAIDGSGNTVTSYTGPIALYCNSAFNGTAQVNAVNGVATFSNISFSVAGTYSFIAYVPGNGNINTSTSNSFTVSAASGATKLAFNQQPTSAVAGVSISPAVKVFVEDAGGNVVTTDSSSVTIAINSGSGTLNGTLTVAAVNGVATFSNLSINTSGAYTLKVTDGTLTSATSGSFNITAAAAAKLAYIQQPTNANTSAVISPAVTVAVEDTFGNIVTTDTSSVTMAINTGTGTLAGTTTVAAVNGIATFSTLSINTAGAFTLKATDGTLTNAISSSFNITTPSTAVSLAFIQQPTNTMVNGVMTPAVTVKVLDINGNIVTGYNGPVAIYCNTMPNGTTTVNAVNGIATFSNLSWAVAGTFSIIAYVPGNGSINTVTSNNFVIS